MTRREEENEILKAEIDRFAERMKQARDDCELLLKRHEQVNADLARRIDQMEGRQ